MALSINTVFEARASTGNDNWGGGFVAGSGGTDFSQQNSVQVAVGGGVVTSTITGTVITFTGSTYTVLAGDLGNIVQFISGTNVTPGFYQITARTVGINGTWTLDRTPLTAGTTTNAVANMGGALATLNKLTTALVGSSRAFITGAFTSAATLTFAQTVATPSSAAPHTHLIGYGSVRGDGGHATLTLQTNTGLTALNFTGVGWIVRNIDIDCGSLGTSTGINFNANAWCYALHCKVANFTTAGITGTSGSGAGTTLEVCELTGGGGTATAAISFANNAVIHNCHVHDNACPAMILGQEATASGNLVENNSGASSDGISFSYASSITRNIIHNNGRDGLRLVSDIRNPSIVLNNILTSNGGWGFNNSSGNALPAREVYDGNSYFNNTSGTRNLLDNVTGIYGVASYTNVRDVILTGLPYIGPTSGSTANFGLNNVAGQGAACRATGAPNTWPGNTGTTSYLDQGAAQHQDTGGHQWHFP